MHEKAFYFLRKEPDMRYLEMQPFCVCALCLVIPDCPDLFQKQRQFMGCQKKKILLLSLTVNNFYLLSAFIGTRTMKTLEKMCCPPVLQQSSD